MINLFFVPLFLCWGSFLNVVAYRLLYNISLFNPNSHCPHCKTSLAWFDLIPLLSWIFLKGQCRYCKQPISWLYPSIELMTAFIFCAMIAIIPYEYWFGYGLLISALLIVIRTDLETLLISRYMTLFLIPFALFGAYLQYIPISLQASMIGSASAYTALWLVSTGYYKLTKKVGLGQGDIDLLAMIGAFTGFTGWWFTLQAASIIASIAGIWLMVKGESRTMAIPFGPFLALGTLLYIFLGQLILSSYFRILF